MTALPWLGLLVAYVGNSVACFVAYAVDKRAAIRRERRTSEFTLLIFGLAGGWPGGLLAQQVLRHKTSKTSFLAWFWVTVALNLAGLFWLGRAVQQLPGA